MSAKVFFYCLKVWLASVFIGPALFWCFMTRIDRDAAYTFADFLGFWGYAMLYSLLFSLISFLLFLISMAYVSHQKWEWHRQRLVIAFLGIVLTVVPIVIFLGTYRFFSDTGRIAFFLSYLLPILAGIFLYPFPHSVGHKGHLKN